MLPRLSICMTEYAGWRLIPALSPHRSLCAPPCAVPCGAWYSPLRPCASWPCVCLACNQRVAGHLRAIGGALACDPQQLVRGSRPAGGRAWIGCPTYAPVTAWTAKRSLAKKGKSKLLTWWWWWEYSHGGGDKWQTGVGNILKETRGLGIRSGSEPRTRPRELTRVGRRSIA